jgi:hypothetical protein
VLRVQVVLFLSAAVAVLALERRYPPLRGRAIARWAAVVLALGALRAAIWASGFPVAVANLVVFLTGAALLGFAYWARRRRRSRPKPAA